MMRTITKLIPILILFGCLAKTDKKKLDTAKLVAKIKSASLNSSQKETSILPNPDDTIPNISLPADAIQVTNTELDSTSNIYVLVNGGDIYSKPALAKLPWKTITSTNYLKDTKTKLKREVYPEGTEEEGNMGLFISATDKNASFLISGLNTSNKHIDTAHLKRRIFYPGQKEEFNYKGTTYTLYATGHKMPNVEKGYDNYKLFLTANVKGHIFNQLLGSLKEGFGSTDDAEVLSDFRVNFIGDIDGDNIPDIVILQVGNFWSGWDLYLSSVAGDKAVFKRVSMFE